jgi:putative ATP-dependent endonuclease of OLD family
VYLAELHVKNFRRLKDGDFRFQAGLNVIVGENNSGKTAIVDAIRTLLNYRRFDRDDLNTEEGVESTGASIEGVFDGASAADEAAFVQGLVGSNKPGVYRIRLAVSATLRGDELEQRVEVGFSSTSGSYYDVLTRQRMDYLQALRDPYGSDGLRAGRNSKFARLLRKTTSEKDQADLCEIAASANKEMQGTKAVARVGEIVNANLDQMNGLAYAMETSMNFVEADFKRLAAQLEGSADGLGVGLMGLGTGNIVYIAAVLGDLENANDDDKRYRALVIEEPEAHLHPQRQILLLRFLEQQVRTSKKAIQVFVTTHSPILASQAAMQNLLPLYDRVEADDQDKQRKTISRPVEPGATTTKEATRIRQYLDATRSELFFAKRLVLVEGDAELLLLPKLAKAWAGEDLEKRGISVVSAAGLNFTTFLPFVKSDVLNIRVAIITDSDPNQVRTLDGDEANESDYLKKLRTLTQADPNLEVFAATHTFEYDLALPPGNRDAIIEAISALRRRKGASLRNAAFNTGDAFAAAFYDEFFRQSRTSKPEFAMELALIIERSPSAFTVPEYIARAFEFVITDTEPSGP